MDYLDNTVTEIERSLEVELIAHETVEQEYDERPVSFDGDRVYYHGENFNIVTAYATGFKWHHPHGGIIRGEFAKPVQLAKSTLDESGDERDFESDEGVVARAILAKVGNIAGVADLRMIAGA